MDPAEGLLFRWRDWRLSACRKGFDSLFFFLGICTSIDLSSGSEDPRLLEIYSLDYLDSYDPSSLYFLLSFALLIVYVIAWFASSDLTSTLSLIFLQVIDMESFGSMVSQPYNLVLNLKV